MLTKNQVSQIKEHLEKAQNPIFFFDNDPDGLCSFLILQKFCGKGKGVPVRSYPGLSQDYFRKVHELSADYIFVLDKPVIAKDFFEEANKINIPVVLIDHHDINREDIPSFVNYYNPFFNKVKSNEPVTHLCYQIAQKKEDLWLEIIGCISDKFVPKEYSQFQKECPELTIESDDAFDIFYKSQIGKIARIFSFALKDRTTNVINMLKFLMKAKSPYDVLERNPKNNTMHERFEQIDKKYTLLLKKAISIGNKSEKLLFFQYGGDLSISSDLANEISHKFPSKFVVVVYITGTKANASIRGKNAKKIILEAINGLENSRGGGHEDAVGAQVKVEDIEKFRMNLEKLIGSKI
jgi:single-stranded DNA-specific DHH superfamily exonuclease